MKLSVPLIALAISMAKLAAALPVLDGSAGSTGLQLSMRSSAGTLDLVSETEAGNSANIVLPQTAPTERSIIFGRSDREGEQHGNGNKARGWPCFACFKRPAVGGTRARPHQPQHQGTPGHGSPASSYTSSPDSAVGTLPTTRQPTYVSPTQSQRFTSGTEGKAMRLPARPASPDVRTAGIGTSLEGHPPPAPAKVQGGDPSSLHLPPTAPAPRKRSSPLGSVVVSGRSDREGDGHGEEHGNGNKARGWPCFNCFKKPLVSFDARPKPQTKGTRRLTSAAPRPVGSGSPPPGYLSPGRAQRVDPHRGLDGQAGMGPTRAPPGPSFSFTDNNPGYRAPPPMVESPKILTPPDTPKGTHP